MTTAQEPLNVKDLSLLGEIRRFILLRGLVQLIPRIHQGGLSAYTNGNNFEVNKLNILNVRSRPLTTYSQTYINFLILIIKELLNGENN